MGRKALREVIAKFREKYPFEINAFVLLPDYFYSLWTLPEEDKDFLVRLRLIKTYVTKHYGKQLGINAEVSLSRQKRQEKNLWQRRFWKHLIRYERDYALHCDYIHYNLIRHGLCVKSEDWQCSSIHRFIAQGQYPPNWGVTEIPEKLQDIWDE